METAKSECRVMLPFRVGIDPMRQLLVTSFRGDPEFEAIEPQSFDDPVNGTGLRVLRYRKDGRVDVYWQPGIHVDRNSFVIGVGIGDFEETVIDPARFQITGHGVDLDIAFDDAQGRKIEVHIHEDTPGKRGFPMLAPVGADIENPLQLFLVYMPDIDLVRRKGSTISARVGDRELHPASLPILLRGRRVWFTRYIAAPVIGTLNPPASRPLIFDVPSPGTSIECGGMSVTAGADRTVTKIRTGQPPRHVEVEFLPGFPNLLELADGDSEAGRWTIWITGVSVTGGTFRVSRLGGQIAVELDVTDSWKPCGLPLSMRIFTQFVPKFRNWPSTYRWRGTVKLGEEPTLAGAWERKKPLAGS